MNAIRDYFPALLLLVAVVTDTDTKASVDGPSITLESRTNLHSTTQEMGRRLPVVTTVPPVNVPDHHAVYRTPPQHRAPLVPHGQPSYFEDSGGSSPQPTSSTPPSGAALDNKDERAESANMKTSLTVHTLAASSRVLKDPQLSTIIPSAATAARAEDARPGSDKEETETTTTTTTTMQSPVPCQMNLTGPEGYIKAPPQSSSAFHSTMDCSYIITVYMGYGVEVQ
ncbi:seizure 6-like protein 2, partial [Brachyistius frenatus]|uniref:seizure 6-like protein 2 n=1 Tax=Brachyistius frenatus TaxID=100188 RepID=UPI0037E77DB4